ncbi:hypothetical protein D3C81_1872640 [compost metagenome]
MHFGSYQPVIGEKVFTIGNHDFFIYPSKGQYFHFWTVSGVGSGVKICSDERYKRAVDRAKEIITKNYDSYVNQVSKLRGEAEKAE